MALYIVVRHPENPDSTYTNEWTGDKRLLVSITTPKDVAMALASEWALNARVFVHRCSWGDAPARIWCSVLVEKIEPLDQKVYLVKFVDPQPMDNRPPLPAHQGQNMYKASSPVT